MVGDPLRRSGSAALTRGYNQGYTPGVKTAISLPDELFQAAEEAARKLGLSRSALYARAIREYLESVMPQLVTAALDDLYANEHSQLHPAVAAAQTGTLPEDDW